ncbi:hypothetical protein V7O61_08270 [Methanolobus sp. WCC1]|jgi:hypothetical protein|uniref:hypothetical protein n=1 Tax=unclassified Methanolobus TaxID=2629569 RepID=UPI00324E4E33
MNGIEPGQLRPGMRVIYHPYIGASGEEHIVASEPWELGSGDWVVKLKDKSGGVGVDFISEILED